MLLWGSAVHSFLANNIDPSPYSVDWINDQNFELIQVVKEGEEIGYDATFWSVLRVLRSQGLEHRTKEVAKFLANSVGQWVTNLTPRRNGFSAAATICFMAQLPSLAQDMRRVQSYGHQLTVEMGRIGLSKGCAA